MGTLDPVGHGKRRKPGEKGLIEVFTDASFAFEGRSFEAALVQVDRNLKLWSAGNWVAVKELKLRDYPPIIENQMEKKMEDEMETAGNIEI